MTKIAITNDLIQYAITKINVIKYALTNDGIIYAVTNDVIKYASKNDASKFAITIYASKK